MILFFFLLSFAHAQNQLGYESAFHYQQKIYNIPFGLLKAIAITESGKKDPHTGLREPWPWTIGNQGKSYYCETKEEAVKLVRKLQHEGKTNIDIGCMQINLKYHGNVFSSLEEAFDPQVNIAYAASLLHKLKKKHHSWTKAICFYHSSQETHAQSYLKKIYGTWDDVRGIKRTSLTLTNKKQKTF